MLEETETNCYWCHLLESKKEDGELKCLKRVFNLKISSDLSLLLDIPIIPSVLAAMSLKYVLKNFLNHFERLENYRKYPNSEHDLYSKEFHSLKELTESLKTQTSHCCKHGLLDVNRRKNRYKDILPCKFHNLSPLVLFNF